MSYEFFRRLTLSEAFLLADAILETLQNVTEGLVVNEKVIKANVENELPFNATENILMAMVTNHGADRQECHEKLRVLSLEAGHLMKNEGKPNDLIERIKNDSYFESICSSSTPEIDQLLDPKRCIGRAPEQVEEFIKEVVEPILSKEKYSNILETNAVLNV